MKTIKDVSEEVNVSKTSIYNLIKKNNIQTYKREGKTYIDEKSESLILAYYSTEQQNSISDIITDIKQDEIDDFESSFQSDFKDSKYIENGRLISLLERELEEKNKTIQALIHALTTEKQYQAARLLTENNKDVMNDNSKSTEAIETRKSFFSRLFKK